MINLFLLIVFSTTFSEKDTIDFSVGIHLLESASREEIKLMVHVRNLAGKPVTILKTRRDDYKREKIRALGNYVIEMEKWESNSYKLFTPSAEMGPSYKEEEFVTIKNGSSISDTLCISGFSFSRMSESKKGFPSGSYRMRIYFNPDMWETNERNPSNWIEFTIE